MTSRADRRAVRARMNSVEGRERAALYGFVFREVARDVYADVTDADDVVTIKIIECGDPGRGKVGRWLDTFDDRHVRVTGVISEVLEGMLVRRNYLCVDFDDGIWEHVP